MQVLGRWLLAAVALALAGTAEGQASAGLCSCGDGAADCGCAGLGKHSCRSRPDSCTWAAAEAAAAPQAGRTLALEEEDSGWGAFISSAWPAGIAWCGFLLILAMTSRNAYRHLLCFSRPDLQPHVLRIIMVGPIYAFSAALCLSMNEEGCFFIRAVRDIWEAVVIYSFLTLIVEYMGGEHMCLDAMAQDRDEAVSHFFPFNLCLPPIPMASMIRLPKIGVLQFVFLKPLLAALSCVAFLLGQYESFVWQGSLFVVYNISYSVALYALSLVYVASHGHPSLQTKRPLLKFVSVKMIVFLTFWQALLIPELPLPGSTVRWEDFVLAIEMVVFAFLMNKAFSWKEFHSGLRGDVDLPPPLDGSKVTAGDVPAAGAGLPVVSMQPSASGQPSSTPIGRSEVLQNARATVNPKDIFHEASTSFSRRYQQHVLIESAQEYELKERDLRPAQPDAAQPDAAGKAPAKGSSGRTFKARTYLLGRSLVPESGPRPGEQEPEQAGASPPPPPPPGQDIWLSCDVGETFSRVEAAAASGAPEARGPEVSGMPASAV